MHSSKISQSFLISPTSHSPFVPPQGFYDLLFALTVICWCWQQQLVPLAITIFEKWPLGSCYSTETVQDKDKALIWSARKAPSKSSHYKFLLMKSILLPLVPVQNTYCYFQIHTELKTGRWVQGKLKCHKAHWTCWNYQGFLEYIFLHCYKLSINFQSS